MVIAQYDADSTQLEVKVMQIEERVKELEEIVRKLEEIVNKKTLKRAPVKKRLDLSKSNK